MIRLFIFLSFKLDTQSWNVPSPLTYWPLKLLTWFYNFTIYATFTIHTSNKSTSQLAYTHCKLKWEKRVNTRLLNPSPTHFQCTGYLHIQTPHHSQIVPIIVFVLHWYSTQFLRLSSSMFSGINTAQYLSVMKPSDKAQVCQSSLGRDSIVDCLKVLFSPQDVIQQGRNTLLIILLQTNDINMWVSNYGHTTS